tara:strand:+ start:1928 stop:2545 length:618 start_codon:yes stop_codon:yes gene_type:complete
MGIMKELATKIFLMCVLVLSPVVSVADDSKSDQYIDMFKGNPDADFIIVEYASFTCPHCASFHKEVLPYLTEKYIDSGKVKFVYREVYFDAPGLWAGLLARCASKEKYFGIVDLLYGKQEKWSSGTSEKEILGQLFSIGRQVGIEEEEINSCFKNKNKSLNLIDAYLKHSKADKITSTPSIVLNGKLMEYSSFAELKEKLDELLN